MSDRSPVMGGLVTGTLRARPVAFRPRRAYPHPLKGNYTTACCTIVGVVGSVSAGIVPVVVLVTVKSNIIMSKSDVGSALVSIVVNAVLLVAKFVKSKGMSTSPLVKSKGKNAIYKGVSKSIVVVGPALSENTLTNHKNGKVMVLAGNLAILELSSTKNASAAKGGKNKTKKKGMRKNGKAISVKSADVSGLK